MIVAQHGLAGFESKCQFVDCCCRISLLEEDARQIMPRGERFGVGGTQACFTEAETVTIKARCALTLAQVCR